MRQIAAVMPYLIGFALLCVIATLFTGLFTMARGGEFNQRHGNRLMRLRVLLQGVTVVLFIAYLLMTRL